ncbi:MAG TPA: molybdopterin-synthase adenylyltransferase MoeB [Kiritimatiellia bacterium]|nr:molybdopterin-synthase adenylyltransferase MoeB [Kiritimatiellia bacterium]HMP97710.1 molybdopterin-synthase adenylyltransferase MoeB [Kiritimatiellia bacterium]
MLDGDHDGRAGLSAEERLRYARHLLLPEVGVAGQEKLKRSRVALVGAGGLGSPAALYLAAAGVGRLRIIDPDVVELSNLQRQVLHDDTWLGRRKTESALARLRAINPWVEVEEAPVRLTAECAVSLLQDADVVVDGADNFDARFAVNEACVALDKPMVYASVFRFEGQLSVFWASRGACYRCLYADPPPPEAAPSCAEAGVLGALPGILGCLQAMEVIKLLLGIGEPLINRLLLFDGLAMRFRELELVKEPDCPGCGPRRRPVAPTAGCAGAANPAKDNETMNEITPIELKQRMDAGDDLLLLDVREPFELAVAVLPGVIPIPLAHVTARAGELDPSREVVVLCRSGGRSAKAILDLRQAGYRGPLVNLKGGMLAWSDTVDPRVPKY